MGELWVQPYETENFRDQLEAILNQTRPLYENLHAFTRMKLRERYGDNRIAKGTKDNLPPPIPSSILGFVFSFFLKFVNHHHLSLSITICVDRKYVGSNMGVSLRFNGTLPGCSNSGRNRRNGQTGKQIY